MEASGLMIKNRDGKRMPASLRLPEGIPIGTFVLFHGLGGSQQQSDLVAVSDVAIGLGYQVFGFDAADGEIAPDADFYNQNTTAYNS